MVVVRLSMPAAEVCALQMQSKPGRGRLLFIAGHTEGQVTAEQHSSRAQTDHWKLSLCSARLSKDEQGCSRKGQPVALPQSIRLPIGQRLSLGGQLGGRGGPRQLRQKLPPHCLQLTGAKFSVDGNPAQSQSGWGRHCSPRKAWGSRCPGMAAREGGRGFQPAGGQFHPSRACTLLTLTSCSKGAQALGRRLQGGCAPRRGIKPGALLGRCSTAFDEGTSDASAGQAKACWRPLQERPRQGVPSRRLARRSPKAPLTAASSRSEPAGANWLPVRLAGFVSRRLEVGTPPGLCTISGSWVCNGDAPSCSGQRAASA